jgi:TRAP transporter TAXI family solute receptor
MYTIINLIIFFSVIYMFYVKRNKFIENMKNNEYIDEPNIQEEFSIEYSYAPSFNYKTPLYTFSLPIISNPISIASGVKGQAYHTMVDYLSSIFPINNQRTMGSLDNITMVEQGAVDLAICQEDVAIDAREGKLFDTNYNDINFVCGLFYEYFILIVDTRKNIKSWADLAGKKVGFTSKTSGSFQNGMQLARAAGLEPGVDFSYKNVSSVNRLMNLFQEQEFDAIYITSSTKNPYIINIAKNLYVGFVGTDGIPDNVMKSYFPHSRMKYISTNSFQTNLRNTVFIKTYSVRACLIASSKYQTDNVYDVIKTVYQNVAKIKNTMANYLYSQYRSNDMIDSFMPSEMFDVHFSFPIHPYAKKYYKEIGFIDEKIVEPT